MAGQAALAAELTNDPLGRGYAGMTDGEVGIDLNTHYRRGTVETSDISEYLLIEGVLPEVADIVLHGTNEAKRVAAQSLHLTLERYETIDMGNATRYAAVSNQLDVLITAGILTGAQKTAVLAMAENKQSRAQELGLTRFHDGIIKAVRT